jgi:hypothetical protein
MSTCYSRLASAQAPPGVKSKTTEFFYLMDEFCNEYYKVKGPCFPKKRPKKEIENLYSLTTK